MQIVTGSGFSKSARDKLYSLIPDLLSLKSLSEGERVYLEKLFKTSPHYLTYNQLYSIRSIAKPREKELLQGNIFAEVPSVSELPPPSVYEIARTLVISSIGRSFKIFFSNVSSFLFKELLSAVKKITGRWFDPEGKFWAVPIAQSTSVEIFKFAVAFDFRVEESAIHGILKYLVSYSASGLPYLETIDIDLPLRDYQKECLEYVVKNKRVIIADDVGLGKTLEALSSVHYFSAFPCITIVPKVMKLAWASQITKWFGSRYRYIILGGRNPSVLPLERLKNSEFVILNYDIVPHWLEKLKLLEPQSIVLDECTYIKSGGARRTKAILNLVKVTNPELRLLLSGTPVLNRPQELIPMLEVLGVFKPLFGSISSFKYKYGWNNTDDVTAFNEKRFKELNSFLREHCYIKRKKTEVLKELPPVSKVALKIELENEEDYLLAETDLVSWLREVLWEKLEDFPPEEREKVINFRIRSAIKAGHLVRIEYLKQVAVKGKLNACIQWIKDFLDDNEEEKLVVFCHHKFVQKALLEAFPEALSILSEDSEASRYNASTQFLEDPSKRLIICSLMASSMGIDLHSASNIAFLELPWTPSILEEQAIGRVHRFGQEKPVTAWILLAKDTVEERIYNLLEKKRKVVSLVTSGDYEGVQYDFEIISDLIKELVNEGGKGNEQREEFY